MSDQQTGPNVRRLAFFEQVSDITIKVAPEPDGQWAGRADSKQWTEAHIERGPDAEAAAANLIAWLERGGEFLPEPPDTFWPWAR
jgi:hypothetical protein